MPQIERLSSPQPPAAPPSPGVPTGRLRLANAPADSADGLSAADQRLLAFLVKSGKIRPEEAQSVRGAAAGARSASAIGLLGSLGILGEQQTADAVARGLGLPLLQLGTARLDEWMADLIDERMATRHVLVPVAGDRESLTVAMANPFDPDAIRQIEFASGRRVTRAVAAHSEVMRAIGRVYGRESTLASVLADVPEVEAVELVPGGSAATTHSIDVGQLAKEAEQAPIIKMVNLILVDALAARASDIHVEPGPHVVLVRYRVNGILVDALQIPKWVQNPITARIKIMAKLDITERRVPQDGHLAVRHDGRVVDVRVSVLPTTDGEKFVMRLLDPGATPRSLDQLGIAGRDLEVLRKAIRRPEGMILVTGPTGSGKSSTLAAAIQEILSPARNIVTIENPVEYQLKGVTQVEVNDKQNLTFAAVLRSVLRQDPDVIMVGEIRDRETAEIAFQAAQTGHLVLSTLHTNDTAATITRLLDLGIEPYVIASSLVAVVAQRLVRTVCGSCGEAGRPAPSLLPLRDASPVRCTACRDSGFSGRTGCYEVLEVTKAVQRLIESRAPESQIRVVAEDEGMIPLRVDAQSKVDAGVTTGEEAARVVQFDTRGQQCPQCKSPADERFVSCPYCQHPLRAACGACGMTLKKEWTACPYCGVAGTSAGAPAAAPAADRPGLRPPAEPPALDPAVVAADPPDVLVVDDYEDVRMLVRLALQSGGSGIVVREAATGQDAIDAVEQQRPHLIVLDLMMPGMDGFEVCRRLRANLKTAFIPILMLTALADTKSKSLGFLAGTDDYLVKPFEAAELRSRVGWLLQRSYRMTVDGAAAGANRPAAAAER